MTKETKKILKEKLGSGKLVELSINPDTKEIEVLDLEYSWFDGIDRQIMESFETVEGNESRAIQLIGKAFPWIKTVYRYLDCLDGFAETDEAKKWTKVYHSESNGKDMYDCSFKYILSIKPGFKHDETIEVDGFAVYFD